jgi:protein subunit release factor A
MGFKTKFKKMLKVLIEEEEQKEVKKTKNNKDKITEQKKFWNKKSNELVSEFEETEEELKELRELKEIVAENRKLADDIELMKREIEKLEEEIQELIYPTKPLEIDLEIEEIEEEIEVGGFENE